MIPALRTISIHCIVCDTPLKEIHQTGGPPEHGAWHDATVDKVVSGHGSRHDTGVFMIGVCDDCMDKKVICGAVHRTDQRHTITLAAVAKLPCPFPPETDL